MTWLGKGPFRAGGRELEPGAFNFLLGTSLGRRRDGEGEEGGVMGWGGEKDQRGVGEGGMMD